jgi:hypothetical protein
MSVDVSFGSDTTLKLIPFVDVGLSRQIGTEVETSETTGLMAGSTVYAPEGAHWGRLFQCSMFIRKHGLVDKWNKRGLVVRDYLGSKDDGDGLAGVIGVDFFDAGFNIIQNGLG